MASIVHVISISSTDLIFLGINLVPLLVMIEVGRPPTMAPLAATADDDEAVTLAAGCGTTPDEEVLEA